MSNKNLTRDLIFVYDADAAAGFKNFQAIYFGYIAMLGKHEMHKYKVQCFVILTQH